MPSGSYIAATSRPEIVHACWNRTMYLTTDHFLIIAVNVYQLGGGCRPSIYVMLQLLVYTQWGWTLACKLYTNISFFIRYKGMFSSFFPAFSIENLKEIDMFCCWRQKIVISGPIQKLNSFFVPFYNLIKFQQYLTNNQFCI